MVLSYLQHLRRRHLKHATILSHIFALSSCTNKVDGVLVGRHPLVAKWVLGDRAQNPPRRSLVPRWNLSVVLAALIEKPFEPLRHASPRNLTLKVLFLLAATSAHRVFESHALCVDPPFLIQKPRSFCLALNPVFLPKTTTEVAFSLDLEITAFYPDPTNGLERGFHLMCPVRALRIYLKCTAHSCGTNRSLFVHWDEAKAQCPVSKQWISSILTEAIRSAYHLKGREHEIISANPHSIRGVATSWAEIVPASEIRRAATWSGPCTFAQFYRLDFSHGGFGGAVLETAVRAGSA